jgi:hypothetical protein
MRIDGTARLPSTAVQAVEKPQFTGGFSQESREPRGGATSSAAADRAENPCRSGTTGSVPHLVLPLSGFAAQFLGQLMCAGRMHPSRVAKTYQETPAQSPGLLRTL